MPGESIHQTKKTNKFVFANGDVYEGEYEVTPSGSIERSGTGTLITFNGVVYSGQWRNDRMNGKGTFDHTISGTKYAGDFVDGKFEGFGKYMWPDGSFYEGEFKNSKLEGKGIFQDPTGQIWSGKFRGDAALGLKFKLNM